MLDEKYIAYKMDVSFIGTLLTIEIILWVILALIGFEVIAPWIGVIVFIAISLFKSVIANLNRRKFPIDRFNY